MSILYLGEIKGFLQALETIKFDEYMMYNFTFEKINSTEADAIKIEVLINWKDSIRKSFSDYDIGEKTINKLNQLFEQFMCSSISQVWKVDSNEIYGVCQAEFIFQLEDEYFYFLMYLYD
ncbi:hypothetical protein [Paenibacillus sp. BC26]|uniref:hypothetical protein n=1 Tax=Paenibacillus sp. BC26 TaxID=1881032 RepID=UPI0008E3E65C|nr:hypothetical protein [Paenibacillus sp. BC26]SFS76038.1 hypothetical protein SAMN05428962_2693 [Paenibacillus sp. BC26]